MIDFYETDLPATTRLLGITPETAIQELVRKELAARSEAIVADMISAGWLHMGDDDQLDTKTLYECVFEMLVDDLKRQAKEFLRNLALDEERVIDEIRDWFVVSHGRYPDTPTEFADFAAEWVTTRIEQGGLV